MTERYATFHDLAGQSVFITGGGSGIGAALTDGFLAQGARVTFVQRSDASGFVAEMARKHGTEPLFVRCDITDIPALQAAVTRAGQERGPVTVLVNNAANDSRHALEELDSDGWDRNQAINLKPHFFSAQAAIPGMKAAGGGSIINFSSISYMMGNGAYASYTAAKSGILGLTRSIARDFGPFNIRANALMPGWVLTQRQLDLWAEPEALAAHLARQSIKQHLIERDVVDTTLFLASKASRMMTGQALVVDGGVVVTG